MSIPKRLLHITCKANIDGILYFCILKDIRIYAGNQSFFWNHYQEVFWGSLYIEMNYWKIGDLLQK
jgi:hypothetical protein